MKTSFVGAAALAVEATQAGNARAVMAHKHNAFLLRRHLLSSSKTDSSKDQVEAAFPALSIDQLAELRAVGIVDAKSLREKIDTWDDTVNTNTVSAYWRWRASSKRVSRKVAEAAVIQVRRTLSSIGIRSTVVGEFARHHDTVSNLQFCLCADSFEDMAEAKASLCETLKVRVADVSATEFRFVMERGEETIPCSIFVSSSDDLCASIVYHTGPQSFIEKVNARLARSGFELTGTGLRDLFGKAVRCNSESNLWDIMGCPTPPTSVRDLVDDVLFDTVGVTGYKSKTGDVGIMFRDGGIIESMKENLRHGLAEVSYAGVVVPASFCSQQTESDLNKARRELQSVDKNIKIGLLVTSNTLDSLVHADQVDYLVVEDDEVDGLYTSVLPAAVNVHKNVVVRNPLMYIDGMCLRGKAYETSEVITRLERMKVAVEVSGGHCYAGMPPEALNEISRSTCRMVIGSACDPWEMHTGLYVARTRCSRALVKEKRLMSAKCFLKWLKT